VPETLASACVSGHLGMTTGTYIEDGIVYVPSKVAAKNNGLSADYISRMCRESQVQSTWHQGMWFVNEASLEDVLAARRDKLEKLAAQQSETLKRLHRHREVSTAQAIDDRRAAATRLQPRQTVMPIPVAALALLNCVLLTTTIIALPTARAAIAAQLPTDFSTRVAPANWLPATDVRNQIAAGASSIPETIKEKLNDFFCWWLACEPKSLALEDDVSRDFILALPKRQATSSVVVVSAPASPSTPRASVIQQPIIERVVETVRTIVQGGLTEAILDARLASLNTELANKISALASANTTQTIRIYDNISDALLFDEVTDLILHSPVIDDASITGGTIAGATIAGTLSNAIDTALATIASLTANELVAINATTTNATSTNLYVAESLGFGSGTGLLQNTAGVISNLAYGANGQVLKMVAGVPAWGVDISGGGSGGAGFFSTTTDELAVFLLDTTDVFLIGNNATTTTGHILEVSGSALFRNGVTTYGSLTAARFVATSTMASVIPFASTTAISSANASTTNLVISSVPGVLLATNISGTVVATTSISGNLLDTSGNWSGTFDGLESATYLANAFSTTSASYFSALGLAFSTTSADAWKNTRNFFSTTSSDFYASVTNAFSTTSANFFVASSTTIPKTYTANVFSALQTFGNASTTNISSSYASSTSAFVGSLSIGALSGFLKATAGAVATSLVDLASDVTGILGVGRGGTGWAAVQAGSIPYGNGVNALATTSAGINGQVLALLGGIPTWTATSTLATINGTLSVSKGGTGTTSFSYGLLLSPGGTSALQNIATSSLGLLTTHVAEGVSLYYTDVRVQTYLGAVDKGFFFSTTSADVWKNTRNFFSTTSAAYFASQGLAFSTTSSDYWKSVNNFFSTSSADYYSGLGLAFSTTSTNYFVSSSTTIPKTYASNTWTGSNIFSSLTLGSLNGPLHANGGVLSATTSVGVLYGGTGLVSAPTYGQMLVGNSSGGYSLTATSSLGIAGGSALSGTQGQVAYFSGTNSAVGTSTLFIASSGNVGIGTTTPEAKLHLGGETAQFPNAFVISPTTHATSRRAAGYFDNWLVGQDSQGNGSKDFFIFDGDDGVSRLAISASGNVGIGTTNPTTDLSVVDEGDYATIDTVSYNSVDAFNSGGFAALRARGTIASPTHPLNGDRLGFFFAGNAAAFNSSSGMEVYTTENHSSTAQGSELRFNTVGNGAAETLQRMRLAQNGAIFMTALSTTEGAFHSVCINPSTFELIRDNDDTCTSSSARYKHDITQIEMAGLDIVTRLKPTSFVYDEAGFDNEVFWGFIAEDMQEIDAEFGTRLTDINAEGEVQDYYQRAVLAVLTDALQELVNITGIFRDKLISWLGDATNGITALVAREGRFSEMICVGSTCLSESELIKLIDQATQSTQPSNALDLNDSEPASVINIEPVHEPLTVDNDSATSTEVATDTSIAFPQETQPLPTTEDDNFDLSSSGAIDDTR
jgi:hypothetical protein